MTFNKPERLKIFILCAGNHTRWGNHLGIPKQLIRINGETLLDRIIRLFGKHGYHNIDIISNDERLKLSNCNFFRPSNFRWAVETFLSTQTLWKNKTLVLLGDVFYTEKAIKIILKSNQGIHFYGRPSASKFTFTPYGEIFAFSFDQNSWNKMVEHSENAITDATLGGRGKLWELYRSIAGFQLTEHKIEKQIFIPIHDFTDDIDSPDEYNKVIKTYEYIASNNIFKKILIHTWVGLRYLMNALNKIIRKVLGNHS